MSGFRMDVAYSGFVVIIILETSFPSLENLKDLSGVSGTFLDVVDVIKISTTLVCI